MPKYYIQTFGCQMNEKDSERMAGFLIERGYLPAESEDQADVLLVNTCSVREKPQQKALSAVGRFLSHKKQRPGVVVGIAGCVAQQEGENLLQRFENLDLVIGTRGIHRLPELIERAREGQRCATVDMEDVDPADLFRYSAMEPVSGPTAFVSIMQGCNNYCSYCIVPYVRGPEISRPAPDVIAEVKRLAESGVREITLLGQNVNSYGLSAAGPGFPELLSQVADVPGVLRVRYTTSHPKDLSDELIRVMAGHPRVMEHIHLPVQAGSNEVLASMNRGYTREHYLDLIDRLRQTLPGIGLTTDLIVGFPGESEDDFQQTLEIIERVRYDETFSFRYTPRPGTAAASRPDDVSEDHKYDRLYRLQDLQRKITEEKNEEQVGLIHEALIEGLSKRDRTRFTGRTRTNRLVHFPAGQGKVGEIATVRITRALKHSLEGEKA